MARKGRAYRILMRKTEVKNQLEVVGVDGGYQIRIFKKWYGGTDWINVPSKFFFYSCVDLLLLWPENIYTTWRPRDT
jgi:glycogen synthase